MRRFILPILGGAAIAALTACLFWLMDKYALSGCDGIPRLLAIAVALPEMRFDAL